MYGKDWLERSSMLLGQDVINVMARSCVVIAGVGGVGGYAAEMMARSGIGHIVLIDSDKVSVSNLNRQIIALHSTLSMGKCIVMEQRLKDINPDIKVTVIEDYMDEDMVPLVMGGLSPDFVIDAIDTLAPKLALIRYCHSGGIPFVSSMGSGAKTDATAVRIADISKSKNCPLAYIIRKKLRHLGISKGFKVVYSEELPDRNAIVECSERNKKSMVGTVSYLPAVFGCVCAQVAIEYFRKISNFAGLQ